MPSPPSLIETWLPDRPAMSGRINGVFPLSSVLSLFTLTSQDGGSASFQPLEGSSPCSVYVLPLDPVFLFRFVKASFSFHEEAQSFHHLLSPSFLAQGLLSRQMIHNRCRHVSQELPLNLRDRIPTAVIQRTRTTNGVAGWGTNRHRYVEARRRITCDKNRHP